MRCVGRCRYGTVHDSHLQQVLPTHAKRQPQRRRATPTLYHPRLRWHGARTLPERETAQHISWHGQCHPRSGGSLTHYFESTKRRSARARSAVTAATRPLTLSQTRRDKRPLWKVRSVATGLTLVLISVNKTAPSSTRALCKPQVEALGPLWARTILDAEHGARAGDTGIRIKRA